MPMRWRCPPENWCGITVDVAGVEADELEQLLDRPVPPALRHGVGWMRNGSPTISPTLIRGFSDVYGSWNTIWTRRRNSRRRRDIVRDVDAVDQDLIPRSVAPRPTSIRASVDLPDPDSPTRPSVRPRAT